MNVESHLQVVGVYLPGSMKSFLLSFPVVVELELRYSV